MAAPAAMAAPTARPIPPVALPGPGEGFDDAAEILPPPEDPPEEPPDEPPEPPDDPPLEPPEEPPEPPPPPPLGCGFGCGFGLSSVGRKT